MTNPFTILKDVCAAVVAELNAANAATFSQSFTAVRTYDASLEVEEAEARTLTVKALYGSPKIEMVTDNRFTVRCPIDIAVRKQCAVTNTSGIDGLATLAGEIYAYLASDTNTSQPRKLTTYNTACWEDVEGVSNQPLPYEPELLHGGLFVAILHFVYIVHA